MKEFCFFVKYNGHQTGLRFVINSGGLNNHFLISHNQWRKKNDEIFDNGFDSLLALQRRLKELFPETEKDKGVTKGEIWFTHLFNSLLYTSQRVDKQHRKLEAMRAGT